MAAGGASDAIVTVVRNGTEYVGECDDLARIFSLMDIDDSIIRRGAGPDGPRPIHTPGPTQCRAIKVDGERCRHTSQTSRMTGGLCVHHQDWTQRGHKVVPEQQ